MPGTLDFLEPRIAVPLAEQGMFATYPRFSALEFQSSHSQSGSEITDQAEVAEIVRGSALFLEILVLGACSFELLHELGVTSIERSPLSHEQFIQRMEANCGINGRSILIDAQNYLPLTAPIPSAPATMPLE